MANAAEFDVDPETLSIIRGMLAEEKTEPKAPPAARFAPLEDQPPAEFVERRSAPQPHLDEVPAAPRQRRLRLPRFSMPRLALPSLNGWRPSRRMILGGAFLAVVIFRPAWIVLALVLSSFVALGLFLFLGTDRIWAIFVALLRRRMARHPDRAPQIAARVDRFAERWDRILDFCPDGTVDGLYFPDLQELMQADDRHEAAMAERLNRLHSQV